MKRQDAVMNPSAAATQTPPSSAAARMKTPTPPAILTNYVKKQKTPLAEIMRACNDRFIRNEACRLITTGGMRSEFMDPKMQYFWVCVHAAVTDPEFRIRGGVPVRLQRGFPCMHFNFKSCGCYKAEPNHISVFHHCILCGGDHKLQDVALTKQPEGPCQLWRGIQREFAQLCSKHQLPPDHLFDMLFPFDAAAVGVIVSKPVPAAAAVETPPATVPHSLKLLNCCPEGDVSSASRERMEYSIDEMLSLRKCNTKASAKVTKWAIDHFPDDISADGREIWSLRGGLPVKGMQLKAHLKLNPSHDRVDSEWLEGLIESTPHFIKIPEDLLENLSQYARLSAQGHRVELCKKQFVHCAFPDQVPPCFRHHRDCNRLHLKQSPEAKNLAMKRFAKVQEMVVGCMSLMTPELRWSDTTQTTGVSHAAMSLYAFVNSTNNGASKRMVEALKAIQLDWFPDALMPRPVDMLHRALDALSQPLAILLFACFKQLGTFSKERGAEGLLRLKIGEPHHHLEPEDDVGEKIEYGDRSMHDVLLIQVRQHIGYATKASGLSLPSDDSIHDALTRMLAFRTSTAHSMMLTHHTTRSAFCTFAMEFRKDTESVLKFFANPRFWTKIASKRALYDMHHSNVVDILRSFDVMSAETASPGAADMLKNRCPKAEATFAVIAAPRIFLTDLAASGADREAARLESVPCSAVVCDDSDEPQYVPDAQFSDSADILRRALHVFTVAASFYLFPDRDECDHLWSSAAGLGRRIDRLHHYPRAHESEDCIKAGYPDTDSLCKLLKKDEALSATGHIIDQIMGMRYTISHGHCGTSENANHTWANLRTIHSALSAMHAASANREKTAQADLGVCLRLLEIMGGASKQQLIGKDCLLAMHCVASKNLQSAIHTRRCDDGTVVFSVSRAMVRLHRLVDPHRVVNGGDVEFSAEDRTAAVSQATPPTRLYFVSDKAELSEEGRLNGHRVDHVVQREGENFAIQGWLCTADNITDLTRLRMETSDAQLQELLSFCMRRAAESA